MLYKKPRGGKAKLKVNAPIPPRLFLDESDGEEFPSSNSGHLPMPPPIRPSASSVRIHLISNLHLLTATQS